MEIKKKKSIRRGGSRGGKKRGISSAQKVVTDSWRMLKRERWEGYEKKKGAKGRRTGRQCFSLQEVTKNNPEGKGRKGQENSAKVFQSKICGAKRGKVSWPEVSGHVGKTPKGQKKKKKLKREKKKIAPLADGTAQGGKTAKNLMKKIKGEAKRPMGAQGQG